MIPSTLNKENARAAAIAFESLCEELLRFQTKQAHGEISINLKIVDGKATQDIFTVPSRRQRVTGKGG